MKEKLRKAIQRLVDAEVADSWKGGSDPQDIQFIELELEKAKADVESILEKLT